MSILPIRTQFLACKFLACKHTNTEAIHIRKEDKQAMNRDEDSYQLSHAYDRFLDTASSRCVKNRKNWVPASSDEGLW